MAKRPRAPARSGRATQITQRPRKTKPARRSATKTTRKATGKKTKKPKSAGTRKLSAAQTEQAYLARRRVYTPELLAFVRQRFEQTGDSLSEIAAAADIHRDTVRKIAKRQKWIPYVPPPQGLPTAVTLLAQAEALELHQESHAGNHGAGTSGEGEAATPLPTDTIARLHRLVLGELAELESLRRQSNRPPRGSAGAVRTLSALAETLQKLQRLQPYHANPGTDDDDMPADIDEFRRELARRIEAFVFNRRNAGNGGGPVAPAMDAAV